MKPSRHFFCGMQQREDEEQQQRVTLRTASCSLKKPNTHEKALNTTLPPPPHQNHHSCPALVPFLRRPYCPTAPCCKVFFPAQKKLLWAILTQPAASFRRRQRHGRPHRARRVQSFLRRGERTLRLLRNHQRQKRQ